MAPAKKAPTKTTSAEKTTGSAAKKIVAKKATARKILGPRVAARRTLIEPHAGDQRYDRRDEDGPFKESVDASRSPSEDDPHQARTVSQPGQGDRGDHTPADKVASKKAPKVRRRPY